MNNIMCLETLFHFLGVSVKMTSMANQRSDSEPNTSNYSCFLICASTQFQNKFDLTKLCYKTVGFYNTRNN